MTCKTCNDTGIVIERHATKPMTVAYACTECPKEKSAKEKARELAEKWESATGIECGNGQIVYPLNMDISKTLRACANEIRETFGLNKEDNENGKEQEKG